MIFENNNIEVGKSLQIEFFKQSLIEAKKDFDLDDIIIDHYNGINYFKNEKYKILFPRSMVEKIFSMQKNKINNYFFKGFITEKRSWVLNYKNIGKIFHEEYVFNKKFFIDEDYYNQMSKSKFILCPTGNCPWSFRFFESIMCLAIPIIHT